MAIDSMDAYTWFRNRVEHADTVLLRSMVTRFAEALMGAEADAVCGAAYGERGERVNSRNGYRAAGTPGAGSIDLAIPKLRTGT